MSLHPLVTIFDNGPIKVEDLIVCDMNGQGLVSSGTKFLCRCGLSENKPFCDGKHKGVFQSKVSTDQSDH
jgi:CDGSH-type Zn-finger protein